MSAHVLLVSLVSAYSCAYFLLVLVYMVQVWCGSLCLIAFPVDSRVPEVALREQSGGARLALRSTLLLGAPTREILLAPRRPDDDARPRGRGAVRGAATVALVFLLRALDLPLPELPLVDVERCQGDEHDPHEHGHQHHESERGGERGEEAELFHAGAVVALGNPVTAVQRHRQPRGLWAAGRHPVSLSRSLSSLTPVTFFLLSGLRAVTPCRPYGYLHGKEETWDTLPQLQRRTICNPPTNPITRAKMSW